MIRTLSVALIFGSSAICQANGGANCIDSDAMTLAASAYLYLPKLKNSSDIEPSNNVPLRVSLVEKKCGGSPLTCHFDFDIVERFYDPFADLVRERLHITPIVATRISTVGTLKSIPEISLAPGSEWLIIVEEYVSKPPPDVTFAPNLLCGEWMVPISGDVVTYGNGEHKISYQGAKAKILAPVLAGGETAKSILQERMLQKINGDMERK